MTKPAREIAYTHSLESPVGLLQLAVDKEGRVLYVGYRDPQDFLKDMERQENKYACGELEYELAQYFAGERAQFTVELRLEGTHFQKAVWTRLLKIPYGETITYGSVAQRIGRRDAARAVGNAVAANRVLIIVPCHRVVPASGGVGNYASRYVRPQDGYLAKVHLLELEGAR